MKGLARGIKLCVVVLILHANVIFAQDASESDTLAFAQIYFDKMSFNFGDLTQGDKIEHIFEFKNVGKSPLILSNVLSTCGCTVPEWSKEPILYDSTGAIKVIFDSSLKIGRQNKVITVRSNSKQGDFHLKITGMVLPSAKSKKGN